MLRKRFPFEMMFFCWTLFLQKDWFFVAKAIKGSDSSRHLVPNASCTDGLRMLEQNVPFTNSVLLL